MIELGKPWKALITVFVYGFVLLLLFGLGLRSPKLVLSLMGIAFLVSAILWEVGGGVALAGLSGLLALPFMPAQGSSVLVISLFIGALALIGAGVGWTNRRERLRRPSEKRPRHLPEDIFQRALNPMLIVDPGGRTIERNDRAIELLGSVNGLSEFIHFDDLDRARAELDRALSLGEAIGLQLRAVSWDKRTLPAEIRMKRLGEDQIWIELQDLSDRSQLERKLWEAEARYRYLIEDAIDTLDTGIMLLDRDHQIIWANQTLGYLFNLDREELIGMDLRRAIGEMERAIIDRSTPHRILDAGAETFVFNLRDGLSERILEFRSVPIETERFKGGRIDHYIDLTEIKKLERELLEKTERLEESNRKLEEFTHVVSHDLKQPTRTIQAFSQFLLEDYQSLLDEQGRGYLNSLQRSSTRMKNLIDDLLRLSSIGTKREPVEPIDVAEVLSEVREDLDALLAEVELVLPESMPPIVANRTRTAELFTNLISNAVKYNDKPSRRVEVRFEETPNEYVFTVEDNGMGIEERYRERIFELFERLNPEDDPDSTGAGLAICKRIVTEMGGRIWLDSDPGEGSAFHFSVPKRKAPAMAPVYQRS